MEPLSQVTSVVAPLLRDNIDTDSIIPASYMRSLSVNPASGLFARWRYRADGSEDPQFVLNDPRFRNARILLAGANFGCGSSRENAVWALEGFGIRCVIALGFSDIFRENAFKNGVLPVELSTNEHAALAASVTSSALRVTVDVAARRIALPSGESFAFELDDRRQRNLLAGADEVAETLGRCAAIERFREQHRARSPWLYAAADAGTSRDRREY